MMAYRVETMMACSAEWMQIGTGFLVGMTAYELQR